MAKQQLPPKSREVWCVACRDVGMTVQGAAVPVLMVVDQDGALAAIGPLEDESREVLRALLTKAMQQPGVGPPRRPQRLMCEGKRLAQRIRAAIKGAGITIESIDNIPALDPVFASLMSSLGERSALGVVEPDRLRALGRRLYALAPWEHLWDSAYIHFNSGGDLDGAHAVFIGKMGVSRAMLLMPDAQTMHKLRSGARASIQELCIDAVQMDPPDALSNAQLREAHQLDLILPGGQVMLMWAVRDGARGIAPPPIQQRLLVALEAAVSLMEAHDIRRLGFHSQLHHDHVHQGKTIHLHLVIPADPTALIGFEYLFFTGVTRPEEGSIPIAIIKAAKRDAQQLVAQLEGIESLFMIGCKLWAIKGGQRIGWLDEVSAAQAVSWRQHSRIRLVISAGGAKRQSLYVKNIIFEQELPLQVL